LYAARKYNQVFFGRSIRAFWKIELGSTTRLLDGGIEILTAGSISPARLLVGFRRCYERHYKSKRIRLMEGAHRRNFATWPLCLHQQPSAIVLVMVRRPPHVVTALITCEPSEADRVVSRWARIVELTAKQGEHSSP
jgi:hypothetical protein